MSQQRLTQVLALLGGKVISMSEKTTSTTEDIDDHDNKGFDPFKICWTPKRKALREFCRMMKKELYPVLGVLFKVGLFAAYNEEAILDVLTHNIISAVSSENGTKSFGDLYKKDHPSPRTIRNRLGKVQFYEVKYAFRKINKKILSYVQKQRKFKTPVLLSIDITYKHFYGKRRKYACTMDRDRGTNYGYKYASCVVSCAGIRFTLHTVAMTQFTTKTEMLEELIAEARKYVKIKTVLLDREFFNSYCIKKLRELELNYLIPVIKHRKKFLHSLRPPCKAKMPLKSMYVPVVAISDPDNQKETLYYCTNITIPVERLEEVIEMYRKRWTVENAFKSQKLEFLGKTYSIDFSIRFFFWVFATLLYNVWVLCNFTACITLGLDPAEQERPLITAFLFGINMRIVFISPLFDDGEVEELLRLVIALVKQYLLKNLLSERIIPAYMINN